MTAADKTKLDGPGVEFAVLLYLFGAISVSDLFSFALLFKLMKPSSVTHFPLLSQLIVLTSNAIGPCSMKRRWSFALQCFGLLVGLNIPPLCAHPLC